MKLTFLGTSTSVGVPVIGCHCAICTSSDLKLHRMRSSVHILTDTHSILVDSGPDLRQQALRHNLTKVDAVLYTHQHLDHTAGFDELRAFCWHREDPLPLYSTKSCLKELERIYDWAFSPGNTYRGYIRPESRAIEAPFTLGNTKITPLPVIHGAVETIGYRFDHPEKSIAYIPDVKTIMPDTFPLLEGLDHLIIDALRNEPHPTHMSVAEACDAAKIIGAKQTWLTHIAHEIDIPAVAPTLPDNIKFAYDTQTL